MTGLIESAHMFTEAVVRKYDVADIEWAKAKLEVPSVDGADLQNLKITPYEILVGEQPGNALVNVGINQLWARAVTAEQVWDSTHAGIGVGDSTTGVNATDTDLLGTNKRYNQCDGSFPSAPGSQQMQFQATYGTSEANFAWQEYGLIIPDTTSTFTSGATKPASYLLLNRKVTSLGTKTSANLWVFTVTMTLV